MLAKMYTLKINIINFLYVYLYIAAMTYEDIYLKFEWTSIYYADFLIV